MLETGFEVYILMRQLSDRIHSFAARMAPTDSDPVVHVTRGIAFVGSTRATYAEAFAFFTKHCRRIEIVRDGNLERFYFAEPPMCQHLTVRTRNNVKWGVSRESSMKKTRDFFSRNEELLEEMRHQQWLQALFHKTKLTRLNSAGNVWKRISFILAVVINVLILSCYQESIGGVSGTLPAFCGT